MSRLERLLHGASVVAFGLFCGWAFWDFLHQPTDYAGTDGPIVVGVAGRSRTSPEQRRRWDIEIGPDADAGMTGYTSIVPDPAWLNLQPRTVVVGPLIDGGWHCYDVMPSAGGFWMQGVANGPKPCAQ